MNNIPEYKLSKEDKTTLLYLLNRLCFAYEGECPANVCVDCPIVQIMLMLN